MKKKEPVKKATTPTDQTTPAERVQEDWKEKYLRALADYRNLEARIIQEVDRGKKQARVQILQNFLSILDDMHRAEVFVKDPGLTLVKEQFQKVLQSVNVKTMELVGSQFDPDMAECVQVVESDQDDIVIEEVRKGYMIDGTPLRVAQVKVGKKTD